MTKIITMIYYTYTILHSFIHYKIGEPSKTEGYVLPITHFMMFLDVEQVSNFQYNI